MEFQAVILAGSQGNALLYPLCEDTPPYLLTIANRPLLHFQLELLHSAGFEDVIIVTRASLAKQVHASIDQWKSHKNFNHKSGAASVGSPTSQSQSLNVRVEPMDHWGGTCAALRHIKELLTNDFFVIQSDLVTNLELSYLADVHRSRQSACTILMQDSRDQTANPATKKKANDEDLDMHFVGIMSDPTVDQSTGRSNLASLSARSTMTPSNRLVFYKSSLEMDDEECQVRKSLLRHCQRISMQTQFKDSHLYLFSHWVLSLICDKTEIQSIQKDLVPYLVKNQFSNKFQEYQTSNNQSKSTMDMIMSYSHSSLIPTQSNKPSANQTGIIDSYSCYILVAPASSYCKRANSVNQYKTINQELSDMHITFNEDVDLPFMPLLAGENFAAAVGKAHPRAALQSSFVASSVILSSDPLSLKKCIVGRNTKIGGGVKASGSLLLDNVVIEDNVQLIDCVIAEGAVIGKGSVLVGCKIGPKFVMPAGTEAKNETLAVERD